MPPTGSNARAVVTGHSRGIGAAIAAHLLMRGVRVLGIARHENRSLAQRYGDALSQLRLDLADIAALTEWLQSDAVQRHFSDAEPRFLVNNAGVLQPLAPLEQQDVVIVARAVAVNVSAALVLSAAFAATTTDGRDRRIMHLSSGAGRKGYAGWSVYCASKAALDNHARAVAADRSPGLRIASIAPGVIDTEMQAEIRSSRDDFVPDRPRFVTMHREGRLIPADRAGRAAVEYLMSDDFGSDPVAELRYSTT
ncbi:MAG: SDR family oxidoreductase [Gemmatimonadaceae bacterium]